MSYSISIIGAGNVVWHLAPALEKAGYRVREVYNRNQHHAEQLATRLYDAAIMGTPDFSRSRSAIFIIAVTDDALAALTAAMKLPEDAIVCHTSGTQPLDVGSLWSRSAVVWNCAGHCLTSVWASPSATRRS